MNKVLMGLLGFGVVLGAGAFFLQRATNAELRAEIAALRDEVQQVASASKSAVRAPRSPEQTAVATTDSRVADENRAELAKLREEIAALEKTSQEATRAAQAATQAARGESPVPVKLTPAGELKNVGRATVNAAVETLLSAAFGGDVDVLANSLSLDAAAQAKAQEWFASLSPAVQAQYGSPEKLVALMLARDAGALTGMQILGQRDLSPDVIGVRVRFSNTEGKTKETGLAFRKTDDGLRMVIPDTEVEKYAKQMAGGEVR